MFEELKKCKTFKEIFTILGTTPFEKMAFFLLVLWCLLPVYASLDQIYWGYFGANTLQKMYATMEGYKLGVFCLGSLTLVFAIFYLFGRISVHGSKVFQKLKQEPWHVFLLLMLLWSCISTLLSDDIATSFHGSAYRFDGLKTYFYYAAVYVCATIIIKSKSRKALFIILSMVANYVSLIVILQDMGVGLINKCFFQDVRSAMFFQYNHTAYFMNLGILALIGLYFYEKKLWLRLVYMASLALQMYGLLVNSTFACYLASCCALIMAMVFCVCKKRKLTFRLFVPALVIFLVSLASYEGYVPTTSNQDMKVNIQELKEDTAAVIENPVEAKDAGHGRMNLWLTGLKMVPERPIFGHGPEQLNPKYESQMLNERNDFIDRPDNEFIQHAIFLGIPGLLFYLAALFSIFICQILRLKQLDKTTLIAAGCVIAYLVSSLFGNTMFYTTPYFYLFLAFAAVVPDKTEDTKTEEVSI